MKLLTRAKILEIMIFFICTSLVQGQVTEIRDFKKYYDQYNVNGSFVLYDQNADQFIFYNPEQYKQAFTPASTFKICNSLIGLETGVIADENFIIPWDSTLYRNANWNRNHDLKSAFRYSTVWYYQELARRTGGQQMKYWLDEVQYGNADTTGGIDLFWLKGGLLVSPEQQIAFLRRLHDNRLPFSQRNMDIVKNILLEKETPDYAIRAKTGWGDEEDRYIGWYVGYIEKNGNVYYFANCVQTKGLDDEHIATARKAIAWQIFNEMDLISE